MAVVHNPTDSIDQGKRGRWLSVGFGLLVVCFSQGCFLVCTTFPSTAIRKGETTCFPFCVKKSAFSRCKTFCLEIA